MKIIDNMYYTDTHVYFWRNKTPFSNFYRRPFTYKGYALQFSEQGFMMEKGRRALQECAEGERPLSSVSLDY